jgi:hypothetical protein
MNKIQQAISKVDLKAVLATDHPMIQEITYEPSRTSRSTSKHADVWGYAPDSWFFALKITLKPGVAYLQQRDDRGDRITPAQRVTTGLEVVGQGNRVLTLQDGEIVAENSTFFPNQEFNDLGIGSSFYVAQERFYRALGVRYVRLYAAAVGRYVWARQGFRFTDPKKARDLGNRMRHYLRSCELPVPKGVLKESWDLVNYEVPGAERDGDKIGKFFALKTFPCWEGFKYLDDADHNKVAIASRKETFSRLPGKIAFAPNKLDMF